MSIDDTLVKAALESTFFETLSDEHKVVLAGFARPATFLDDEFIFRQDEAASAFWIVLEGRVALEVHSPRGARTIQTVKSGVLGFSWLFEPHRWQFDGRVTAPVTAVEFDGLLVREACNDDHELGYQLMDRFADVVVQRLQNTRVQLLDLYA